MSPLSLTRRMVACACCALAGCTYGPPVVRSQIAQATRKPDSRALAILVQRTTLREPTGLSTFPDGGKPEILGSQAAIYLFDADRKGLRTLTVLKAPSDQVVGFEPWLQGWRGDDVYVMTSGCPPRGACRECRGPCVTRQYFEVDPRGTSVGVAALPGALTEGRNSPLAAWPDEINYMRVSRDSTSVDVTTTDPNGFHRVLELDGRGDLRPADAPG